MFMAIKAASHAQVNDLRDPFHLLHFAMAALAGDTRVDVRAMVEIDMVRQLVDTLPSDRVTGLEDCGDFFDFGTGGLGETVAVHANLCWRDTGRTAFSHAGMAIHARDLHHASVFFVGEIDRLFGRVAAAESVGLRSPAHG